MDPNETLRRIRALANREVTERLTEDETQELRELVDALDQGISAGGSLPTVWNASHPPF